jgi:propanol-preferring alcohol dehydrogenase
MYDTGIMRALRVIGPGRAAVVDVAEPVPAADEVLLRVLAAGVCRTDLALVRAGAPERPVTLGHEIVGQVIGTGSAVTEPWKGATVAVYELIGCGRCHACGRGEDNLCREAAPAVPGITRDGGMAERVAVPARNLVDAAGVDALQAAPMTDAGMTALHAVERARPWLVAGATAVIIGIGGLGHLAVQFATATAQARVVAVDVDPTRLRHAQELGAAAVVPSGEGAAEHVLAANAGRPVDAVIDFVGSHESLDMAARVTGRGGAIVVTGGGGGRLSLTAEMGTGRFPDREVTMIHTFGGAKPDLVKALALAEQGAVRAHVQTFALEEAGQALAELEAGRLLGRAVIVP